MTNPEIVFEEPLSSYDVKKNLKVLKKRDEELGFRANRCEAYVNQFTPLTDKDATALKKELVELEIPRLKDEHIIKLVDILPHSVDDIKLILSGYALTIKSENLKKIEDILAKYRK